MSGALHHLGLSVPGPYLGANESNPKGFFESSWAVSFHKAIERRAGIQDFDGRPEAIDLATQAITADDRDRLRTWLLEHRAGEDADEQLVVKDPRSVWAQGLWKQAAADAGLSIRYVAMLRHPAETVGSRSTYYASKADAQRRRHYEVASVARWVNSSLVTERGTRGELRAFVPYVELLEGWRPVLARVADRLGLTYDPDPSVTPHPVDDFIDPDLRRVRVGWDDLEVPDGLRTMAQDVWDCLTSLAAADDPDPGVQAELDRMHDAYAALYLDSRAICNDAVDAAANPAPKAAARRRPAKKAPAPSGPEDRLVRDVTSGDLVRLLGRRVTRRAAQLRR
jgi:hypothetical protein